MIITCVVVEFACFKMPGNVAISALKERWKRHEYGTIMMSAKFTRVVPAPFSFTHITALSRPAADDPTQTVQTHRHYYYSHTIQLVVLLIGYLNIDL